MSKQLMKGNEALAEAALRAGCRFYSGYPIRFRLDINGALPGLFRAALFSGDFNRHILEQLRSGSLE